MTRLSRADRNSHPACLHPFSATRCTSDGRRRRKRRADEGGKGEKKSAFLLTGACVCRDRIKTNDATETQAAVRAGVGGEWGMEGMRGLKQERPFWGVTLFCQK